MESSIKNEKSSPIVEEITNLTTGESDIAESDVAVSTVVGNPQKKDTKKKVRIASVKEVQPTRGTEAKPPTTANTALDTEKLPILEDHGYQIGKEIGSGTYAKVKVAYSEKKRTTVAIKIISKLRAPNDYLKRFLPREIDVVKGLKHDNLIRFYQSIETTHRVYIVMQYAENGTLLDRIHKLKYFDENLTRKYFRQLISAVSYCHSQGIAHRDIKCENLLLDKDQNLKLIDFGFACKLSKDESNRTLSKTYCGSFAYASPEVLKGIPYDPYLSDTWACGVVFYAMLLGCLPFNGNNINQLQKQVQSKIPFPKSPQIKESCRSLIIRILSPVTVRMRMEQIKEDPWYNATTPITEVKT